MIYDLEERTYKFAKQCRDFVNLLPKTTANIEYGKQLIKSSASQAANYIEANEKLGKKDFVFRMKIARKESKETALWLKLCEISDDQQSKECELLLQESIELRKIFTAIISKSE